MASGGRGIPSTFTVSSIFVISNSSITIEDGSVSWGKYSVATSCALPMIQENTDAIIANSTLAFAGIFSEKHPFMSANVVNKSK